MKRYISSLLITASILACAGAGLPEAGTAGAELFMEKCTTCHSWPHPARHNKREWDHYLGLMESHMEEKGIPFSAQEKQVIQSYLYRNAR